jgi:ribosome biogenesis GTPase
MGRRYTEHDVEHYDRPKRRTRPRTKDRPSYDEAVLGTVTAVDRGRYTLLIDDSVVTAMTARALGRKAVVVGDRVRVVGDTSGADGSLARIVEVTERTSVWSPPGPPRGRRPPPPPPHPPPGGGGPNADQLVIVTALADPEPRTGLVDRALVAAYDAGIEPLLCLTKSDLADPEGFLAPYRSLGVPWVVTRLVDGQIAGLDEVRGRLDGRTSVLLGHSGVGKSTLFNALVPDARRETGDVNDVTGRGRHTSTSAVMHRLPGGGWLVDTPGIRSFGLAHVEPEQLIGAFTDLDALTVACPRGCTHGDGVPECGLDQGDADPERVASYRRLLAARSGTDW